MKRIVNLFVFLVIGCFPVVAQLGAPYMKVFEPKAYSSEDFDTSPQIVDVIQDSRGVIYCANASGILEFDTQRWRLVKGSEHISPQKFAMDSKGRIFVGGQNDLGFLEVDSLGAVNYTSLLNNLDSSKRQMGIIWGVEAVGDRIYFQSREKLIEWKNKTFTVWEAETGYNRIFAIAGQIYIQDNRMSVFKVVDKALEPVGKLSGFHNYIRFILPGLERKNSSRLLLADQTNTMYWCGENLTVPFYTKADEILRNKELVCGLGLPDKTFAIGTRLGGLVIINDKGALLEIINDKNGLKSNGVSDLFLDRDNGLWLTQTLGTARIELNTGLRKFDKSNGIEGLILSIIMHKKKLYVATMNGVFVSELTDLLGNEDFENTRYFKRINGIVAQCLDFSIVDGKLIVASSEGVYEIIGDESRQIKKNIGASLTNSLSNSKMVYVGLVNGISVLESVGDKWLQRERVEGFKELAMNNAITDKEVLWSHNDQNRLSRIDLSSSPPIIDYYDTSDGLPQGWIHPILINDTIYFGSTKGVYVFNSRDERFTLVDRGFGEYFSSSEREAYGFRNDSKGNVWVVSEGRVGAMHEVEGGNFKWESTASMRIPKSDIWAFYLDSNDIAWIANNEGLVRYDSKIRKNFESEFYTLIRSVVVGKDSVIFKGAFEHEGRVSIVQPKNQRPRIPFKHYSISFEFASPFFDNFEQTKYQYYLEGYDQDWSDWSLETKNKYTGIPEGDYVFKVRAKNVFGKESQTGEYAFTVLTPFYRSTWFYAIQFGFLLLLFVISYRFGRSGGKLARLAPVIATVAIVVMFEYFQNYVEDNFEDLLGGITFLKVLVNVLLVFMLLPLEGLIKRLIKTDK